VNLRCGLCYIKHSQFIKHIKAMKPNRRSHCNFGSFHIWSYCCHGACLSSAQLLKHPLLLHRALHWLIMPMLWLIN